MKNIGIILFFIWLGFAGYYYADTEYLTGFVMDSYNFYRKTHTEQTIIETPEGHYEKVSEEARRIIIMQNYATATSTIPYIIIEVSTTSPHQH